MEALDKAELLFLNTIRIILAKKFGIPPDDIDICAIFDCVKRAIQSGLTNSCGIVRISPLNKREQHALHSNPYGVKIVDMIFASEYPFKRWAEKYEENLLTAILLKKQKGNEE